MTSTEYRTALAKLGLSQMDAARLFDVSDRTGRRWALGEGRVPTLVATLLRLMIKGKITAKDLAS